MTHDIFISYSSAQSDAAQAVCHLLEQHDIKCWMAPRNLTGGASRLNGSLMTSRTDSPLPICPA